MEEKAGTAIWEHRDDALGDDEQELNQLDDRDARLNELNERLNRLIFVRAEEVVGVHDDVHR